MSDKNTRNLAEKIAALLSENGKESDDDFLRSSLEKISQRLDKIESRFEQNDPKSKIQNQKTLHISQERFKSLEELADEIIAGMQNEKACPYEPTSKPCDNCAMCNSRGF